MDLVAENQDLFHVKIANVGRAPRLNSMWRGVTKPADAFAWLGLPSEMRIGGAWVKILARASGQGTEVGWTLRVTDL
jgi:hypothetical protein